MQNLKKKQVMHEILTTLNSINKEHMWYQLSTKFVECTMFNIGIVYYETGYSNHPQYAILYIRESGQNGSVKDFVKDFVSYWLNHFTLLFWQQ